MKTSATLCSFLVLVLGPTVVLAADGAYVSGLVGASWLSEADFNADAPGIRIRSDIEFDTGLHLGAAVGYDFGSIRAEAEFGYQSHEFKELADLEFNALPLGDRSADGDLDAFVLLINAFYDIDTGTRWTPYLGGGIGYASLEVNDIFVAGIIRGSDEDTVFAYQVAGGMTYEITERIVADLSYRFVQAVEPDFIGLDEYNSHNLLVAIRFAFW